jgi:hypothetical protein
MIITAIMEWSGRRCRVDLLPAENLTESRGRAAVKRSRMRTAYSFAEALRELACAGHGGERHRWDQTETGIDDGLGEAPG